MYLRSEILYRIYTKEHDPRIAVEVLLGHGKCHIIAETSVHIPTEVVVAAVYRIAGWHEVDYVEVPQDNHLSENQADSIRCGDNGMPDEKLLVLLRKCGHFLHHSVGRDGDTAPLLRALTPEEKLILETLLEKCLKSWEPQHKAEPED